MGELNRQQHTELEGSFSTDPLFGGFIAALGDLFVPGKAAQTGGNHYAEMVNLLDSINRRLVGVLPGYVYKDGSDTEAQFSVKAFSVFVRGMLCTFAGATAQGPLATGANKIWADVSAAPTISLGFGASWPGVPFIALAEVSQPAGAHWLPTDMTAAIAYQGVSPPGAVSYSVRKEFDFNSGAGFSLGTVPASARMIPRHVIIDTAFDGTAPTLKVGDAGDDDRLIETVDLDLKTIGKYDIDRHHLYTAQTEIVAALDIDGSTAGAGVILLEQF